MIQSLASRLQSPGLFSLLLLSTPYVGHSISSVALRRVLICGLLGLPGFLRFPGLFACAGESTRRYFSAVIEAGRYTRVVKGRSYKRFGVRC